MTHNDFDLERHRRLLMAFAVDLCGDRTAAEDLVQETMCKAWKARVECRYEDCGNLSGWLMTILRKSFYSAYERRKTRKIEIEWESLEQELYMEPTQFRDMLFSKALEALVALPQHQQEIFVCKVCEGLSYEEIALQRGVPVGTVKSGLNRACENLRSALDPYVKKWDEGKLTVMEYRMRKFLSMIGASKDL